MRVYRLHRSVWGWGFDRHPRSPKVWHLRLGIWCATNEIGNGGWIVRDPWPTRLREAWCKHVWCRIVGHDYVTKFSGTRLCRRH